MKKGEWSKETKMLSGILGTNVRALRTQQKISQETLAERSGLSPNEIGKIESKKANPCLEVLAALAKGFDVPVEILLDPHMDPKTVLPYNDIEVLEKIKLELTYLPEEERQYIGQLVSLAASHYRATRGDSDGKIYIQ